VKDTDLLQMGDTKVEQPGPAWFSEGTISGALADYTVGAITDLLTG
jgi:hypothetical protein